MAKTTNNNYPQLFLRMALGTALLSAVADRLGLWGANAAWGDWKTFEAYTRQLTFFLPQFLSKVSAYIATILEATFGLLLIVGFKIRPVANLTGMLLLVFALCMTVALGVKSALDYSVWVGSAAAFLLAQQHQFPYSIDQVNRKN